MSVALSTMVDAAIAHSPADGIAVGTVHGDTAEFVCHGRRLAYPVTASATTQAMLSGAPCAYARSKPLGNLLRRGGQAQCRVQRTAVDDGGQSVGAEQVAIADKGGAERQVRYPRTRRAHA